MVTFDPEPTRYQDRWADWAEKQPDLVRLRNELLQYGGDAVVPILEPHVDKLLNSGHIIDPIDVMHTEMQMSRCHRNAAILYTDRADITEIGSGWALSDDGLWRQHSWAMRGDEIVETTKSRTKYYGVLLSGESAENFCNNNFL